MTSIEKSLPPPAGEGWMGAGPPHDVDGCELHCYGGFSSAERLVGPSPSGPRAKARAVHLPRHAGEGREGGAVRLREIP